MGSKTLSEVDEGFFDAHFNANVKAPLFLVKKAAEVMPKPGGRIIFLSTSLTAASTLLPNALCYVASKGAIEQVSRVLAKDLGAQGFTVNTVSPGPVDSALFREGKPQHVLDGIAAQIPSRKIAEPEDVAPIVAFLASPAAQWINGQVIGVNGPAMYLFATLLAALPCVHSLVTPRQAAGAFFNPTENGGSMLDDAGNGLGEPLNVIISGLSSSGVLSEAGFENYANAIGFSTECLGIHIGGPQSANLGDGNGSVNQTVELRQDYGDATLGTCLESLLPNTFELTRLYIQNGPQHNTGALFLAVSKEEDAADSHNIVADGYNIGRDELVAAALGTTSFGGTTYSTTAQNLTGLLAAGSAGVNHDIATDGITTLLTVTIV
ncbi:hypothetical protein D9757_000987 [Collybiopsis confluens]|uniref:Uncharacterized protein n=1 Tax=Collybiopsis confluens TaxID=2823264 RepID=A0A8H5I021_9AGAR|nr:hypothetical protein D9757_000987 [Collybiopsis confluens]